MAKKYYAVKAGRNTGIFETWDEAKEEVHGFKNAIYKSFKTMEEAENYMMGDDFEANQDLDGKLLAYVDGSFSNILKKYSAAAVFVIDGEIIHKESMAYDDKEHLAIRNVAGEIKASMMAINYAIENNYKEIDIFYDYEGIRSWAMGYWKTNKDETKAYKKFFDEKKEKIFINFHKVEAHTGDKFNEMVDSLAKEALIKMS